MLDVPRRSFGWPLVFLLLAGVTYFGWHHATVDRLTESTTVVTKSPEGGSMNDRPADPGVLVHLPADLHYLIEPALRFGLQTMPDVYQYLEQASPQQMDELRRIADRVLTNDHYPVVTKFLDVHSISEHPESAKLYFLFGALDSTGLQFDRVP